MNNQQRIETMTTLLRDKLKTTQLDIIDDSQHHVGHAGAASGGGHFTVIIASPLFVGKSRVICHRLVYEALGDMMQTDIHALSIRIQA